jgi:hypothetical protein
MTSMESHRTKHFEPPELRAARSDSLDRQLSR